jgi:hypothetical protein
MTESILIRAIALPEGHMRILTAKSGCAAEATIFSLDSE